MGKDSGGRGEWRERGKEVGSSLPAQMPQRFGFPGRDTPSLSPEVDAGQGHGDNTRFSVQLPLTIV